VTVLQTSLNYDVGSVWHAGLLAATGEVCYPRRYNGFAYEATQTKTGRTGKTEPVWPTAAGSSVTDGAVTWRAFAMSSVTWTCFQLYSLGPTEPTWPTTIGSTVVNGSTTLKCGIPVVADALCPHTSAILSASGKIFATDSDAVRYSATSNPLGWSPKIYPSDAGFLDIGSSMASEPVINALALFRGNMAAIAHSTVQIWQLDPDPARIALVDTIEGIGTPYGRAHAAVQGDLFITTAKGVRSLSAATVNQGAGTLDVGTPIDELVVAELAAAAAAGNVPRAMYNPGLSEFWLFVNSTAFVMRQSKQTGFAAWSRYTLPGVVDAVTTLGTDLWFHVPTTGKVYMVDPAAFTDDGVQFQVSGELPYIELTPDGTNGMVLGVDGVASGAYSLSVAYDERDTNAVTTAIPMPAKSKPDGLIPVHLNNVPSVSLRFTQQSATAWSMDELQLHFEPLGGR
jgi:hypothetical protein